MIVGKATLFNSNIMGITYIIKKFQRATLKIFKSIR